MNPAGAEQKVNCGGRSFAKIDTGGQEVKYEYNQSGRLPRKGAGVLTNSATFSIVSHMGPEGVLN